MTAEIVLAAPASPAVSVVDRAGALLAEQSRYSDHTWYTLSGQAVSGEDAAQHLEAVRELLAARGWRRDWDSDSDGPADPGPIDESAPTRDLIRYLVKLAIRVLRHEYFEQPRGLVLSRAVHEVDADVSGVAGRCLDLVLRAETGAPAASYAAWSRRPGRTIEQVTELLTQAAEFARRYGPEVAA